MKKAIVIGATSGIGRSVALRLINQGYKVAVTGRKAELLNELKTLHPDSVVISAFDLTHTVNTIECLNEFIVKMGGVDLLIMSSGVGYVNEELIFELEQQTLDLNVKGFTAVADWAFNLFRQQGYGHFANISSIAGLRGSKQSLSYGASKAYQINYLQALKQKATSLKLPIYITDICPGFVDTAMAKGEGLFWVAPADKAAKQIIRAINNKKQVVYITKRWRLIAIILKLLPNFIYNRL